MPETALATPVTPESRARAERILRTFLFEPKTSWDDDFRAELQAASQTLEPELRALSAGALVVPVEFMPDLSAALKHNSGIMDGCRVVETEAGGPLDWPTMDDVANSGERVVEGAATADNVDPALGTVELKTWLYSSKIIRVPAQLVQDAQPDVLQNFFEQIGERIGRIFNLEATTGDGSSKPRGLITGLLADTTPVAAAAAGAITHADILKLEKAVDPAYRELPGVGFMMHGDIWTVVRGLLDSGNRPIFPQDPANRKTLLGYPVFINQDMDNTVATGKETIVFGLLKKYIVRRGGRPILMTLTQRYAESFQVGYCVFDRLDGRLVTGGSTAIRVLQQP